LETDPDDRFASAIDVANALAGIDGHGLDWRLTEKNNDQQVWTKDKEGTKYEFTIRGDSSTECFKTVGDGQRRRYGDGCSQRMTDREIRTFLWAT
jgi:hypothetical protein